MITISTNINKVVQVTVARLAEIGDTDKLLRTCATSVRDLMQKRIHQDGLASDGSPIGSYSKGYMTLRLGTYGNGKAVNSRGANKGKLKITKVIGDAGVFTKGKNKGATRPHYNVLPDPKVIASLTREMQNDFKVTNPIKTQNGYAIGFSNKHNFDKSQWVEATYKKEIFSLADTEKTAITEIVNNAISG